MVRSVGPTDVGVVTTLDGDKVGYLDPFVPVSRVGPIVGTRRVGPFVGSLVAFVFRVGPMVGIVDCREGPAVGSLVAFVLCVGPGVGAFVTTSTVGLAVLGGAVSTVGWAEIGRASCRERV